MIINNQARQATRAYEDGGKLAHLSPQKAVTASARFKNEQFFVSKKKKNKEKNLNDDKRQTTKWFRSR